MVALKKSKSAQESEIYNRKIDGKSSVRGKISMYKWTKNGVPTGKGSEVARVSELRHYVLVFQEQKTKVT